MKDFKKYNNITGWSVFLISLIVYTITVEPSASLWDCGEFIAAANKLEVGHPPGAPIFMLMGRGASMFASPESAAWCVNMVSVVCSAFSIMFLHWTIVLLGLKIIDKDENGNVSATNSLLVLGAGIIGALAFTFSDSFWFSATEAEVYATSSFFTAFVFWAILKWETIADEPGSDRWIILIAYMVGLSIGVHLLNLLAIPAIGFIYYFRKFEKPNMVGAIITFLVSSIVVSFIQSGVIIGLPSIAKGFELLFVMDMGMPIHSGLIIFLFLIIGGLALGIYLTHVRGLRLLHTAFLSLSFILIGYSSYTVIVVRSQYKPPLNENDPGRDVMSLTSFLKREQYGDWSIGYGPQFGAYSSSKNSFEKGDPIYRRKDDNYIIYDYDVEYKLDEHFNTVLPRMSRGDKAADYASWLETHTDWEQTKNWDKLSDADRRAKENLGIYKYPKPTGGQNLSFMWHVQMNNMYWRYFGWNFIGRSGDIKGGIPGGSVDAEVVYFSDDEEPSNEQSLAYNRYFMLPFLLGMLGLFYHYSKWNKTKDAFVVTLLFFFTGLAIILYLNAPPMEPRERDYAYAGSFYAFAIEIGIGVLALFDILRRVISNSRIAVIATVGVSSVVPIIMAQQGWDDHDRSGRYFAVDSAKNLLDVCDENAILFTAGDNDTFPLWYLQEVEGYRTDVRVCNLSLLNTTWYAEQMKLKAFKSEPLPIKVPYEMFAPEQFSLRTIPKAYANPSYPKRYTHSEALDAEKVVAALDAASPKLKYYGNDTLWYLPTRKLKLKLNKEELLTKSWIPEIAKKNASDVLVWNLPPSLDKKSVMMMDMIVNNASNGWDRPIYFSTTMGGRYFMNLQNYMQQEGLAYRLLPFKPVIENNIPQQHKQYRSNFPYYINTDVSAEKLLKTVWRGLDDETIFYDVPHKILPNNVRHIFAQVALQCISENKIEKARELLNYSVTKMPHEVIPFESSTYEYIRLYMLCAGKDKNYDDAFKFTDKMLKVCDNDLRIWENRFIKDQNYRISQILDERFNGVAKENLSETQRKLLDIQLSKFKGNSDQIQHIQLNWEAMKTAYQYLSDEQKEKKAEYKKYLEKHSGFMIDNNFVDPNQYNSMVPKGIPVETIETPADTIDELVRDSE